MSARIHILPFFMICNSIPYWLLSCPFRITRWLLQLQISLYPHIFLWLFLTVRKTFPKVTCVQFSFWLISHDFSNDWLKELNYGNWLWLIKISLLGSGDSTSSSNTHDFPESDLNQGDVTKERAGLGRIENGFCETKMSTVGSFNMVY